jgi:hypothetical protein
MAVNLPTELLRRLTAIVDTGSMLRATERVFVTQLAFRLQMKRLEDFLQVALFRRDCPSRRWRRPGDRIVSPWRPRACRRSGRRWSRVSAAPAGPAVVCTGLAIATEWRR